MKTGTRRSSKRRSSNRMKSMHNMSYSPDTVRPAYHVPNTEIVHLQFVGVIILAYMAIVGFIVYNQYKSETTSSEKIILNSKSAKSKKSVVKKTPKENQSVTNMQKHAAEGRSASRPVVKVANTGSDVSIDTTLAAGPDMQSKRFMAVRDSMDGVGRVVPVKVDGVDIDRIVVQTAIEDNKDFYPRVDQSHEYEEKLQQFDATQAPQPSMFSPLPPTPFGFG